MPCHLVWGSSLLPRSLFYPAWRFPPGAQHCALTSPHLAQNTAPSILNPAPLCSMTTSATRLGTLATATHQVAMQVQSVASGVEHLLPALPAPLVPPSKSDCAKAWGLPFPHSVSTSRSCVF